MFIHSNVFISLLLIVWDCHVFTHWHKIHMRFKWQIVAVKQLGHSVLMSWLPLLYVIDLEGYFGTVVHCERETL